MCSLARHKFNGNTNGSCNVLGPPAGGIALVECSAARAAVAAAPDAHGLKNGYEKTSTAATLSFFSQTQPLRSFYRYTAKSAAAGSLWRSHRRECKAGHCRLVQCDAVCRLPGSPPVGAPVAAQAGLRKSLEGFYFRCLRRISREFRKQDDGVDKASRDDVFRACNVPTIEEILTERRLRWIGHLIRTEKIDPAKDMLWKEMDEDTRFTRIVNADLRSRGLSWGEAQRAAENRAHWRRSTSARSGSQIPRPRRWDGEYSIRPSSRSGLV